jgi:hypothetical protein
MFKALQLKTTKHNKPYSTLPVCRERVVTRPPTCYPPPPNIVSPLPHPLHEVVATIECSKKKTNNKPEAQQQRYLHTPAFQELFSSSSLITPIEFGRLLVAGADLEKDKEINWDAIRKYNQLHGKKLSQVEEQRPAKFFMFDMMWVTNALGVTECFAVPKTKTSCGFINHPFVCVFPEMLIRDDIKYLSKLMDVFNMLVRLIAEFKGGDDVMIKVSRLKVVGRIERKPMFDTFFESVIYIDQILDDKNVNMEDLFVKFLGLLKTDFIQFWMRDKKIMNANNQWDIQISVRYNLFRHYKHVILNQNEQVKAEVKAVVKEQVKAEVKEQETCIHTCGFSSDSNLKSNFNYKEVKDYLDQLYDKYIDDPNTVIV